MAASFDIKCTLHDSSVDGILEWHNGHRVLSVSAAAQRRSHNYKTRLLKQQIAEQTN